MLHKNGELTIIQTMKPEVKAINAAKKINGKHATTARYTAFAGEPGGSPAVIKTTPGDSTR